MNFRVLNDKEFKFEDMNAMNMVEKLLIVTEDAKAIWDAFDEL